MDTFIEISPQQAWELVENEGGIIADVRDSKHFAYSRPPEAFHLTNLNYGKFLDEADFDEPVIVICYHGVSSRNAAQFLVEQGYERVYSVKGGFDNWVKSDMPIETAY